MAVALRGHQQLSWNSSTPAQWPTGTVAGDLAIVWSAWPSLGPARAGWSFVQFDTWWKILTAADVVNGPGAVGGRLWGLVVLSGARGVGKATSQRGVTVREAGGALLVEGWTRYWTGASGIGPHTNRLGSDIMGYHDQWCAWWFVQAPTKGFRQIDYDGDSWGYRAFEILPVKAPAAPVLTGSSGMVDNTQPIPLMWSPDGDSDGYRIRLRPSGSATWQYLTAVGALSATQVSVTSSATATAIAVGTITGEWEWSAATSLNGLWSDYTTPALKVLPATPPTPAPVLATTFGNLAGEFTWTATTPEGQQTAYQVACSAATIPGPPVSGAPANSDLSTYGAFWMSHILPGAAVRTMTDPLEVPNGTEIEGWVRIQQTGGLWSKWVSAGKKTLAWTAPTPPTSVTGVDGAPLTVTVTGIVPTAAQLEVESSKDSGLTWGAMAIRQLPNSSESLVDPLTGYGESRTYRARIRVLTQGVLLPSVWVASAPVVSTDRNGYLVDPTNSLNYLPIWVREDGTRTVQQGVHVFLGIGDTRPSVDFTPAWGEAGTTVLAADGVAYRTALIKWLTEMPSWIMRWPPETVSGATIESMPTTRMSKGDGVEFQRLAQAAVSLRNLTLKWTEI